MLDQYEIELEFFVWRAQDDAEVLYEDIYPAPFFLSDDFVVGDVDDVL